MLNDDVNIAGPILPGVDQMLAKTSWTIDDFPNGEKFIGRDGVISATEAAATKFDTRQYRMVQVLFRFTALTGGVTPTLALSVYYYDSSDSTSRINNFDIGNATFAASGTRAQAVMGDGVTPAAGSGTSYSYQTFTYTPQRPLWMLLRYNTTGGPTGITTPFRLHVYGIR